MVLIDAEAKLTSAVSPALVRNVRNTVIPFPMSNSYFNKTRSMVELTLQKAHSVLPSFNKNTILLRQALFLVACVCECVLSLQVQSERRAAVYNTVDKASSRMMCT